MRVDERHAKRVLYIAAREDAAQQFFGDMLASNNPEHFSKKHKIMEVAGDFYMVRAADDHRSVQGHEFDELRYVWGYNPPREIDEWLRTRVRPKVSNRST